MAPNEDARDGARQGGSDGVDLEALVARLEQVEQTLDIRGERIERCEARYVQLVERLRLLYRYNEGELAQLLAE
mgnify:CR=1 FL=1